MTDAGNQDLLQMMEEMKKQMDANFSTLQREVDEMKRRTRSPARSSSSESSSSKRTRRSYRSRSRRPRSIESRSGRSPRLSKSKNKDTLPRSGGSKGKSPLRTRDWGERMDSSDEEAIDYEKEIIWRESEEEDGGRKLVEVSEKTKSLLESRCTQSVPNEKRKKIRARFPQPKVAATKTPRLDDFLKATIPTTAKNKDTDAAEASRGENEKDSCRGTEARERSEGVSQSSLQKMNATHSTGPSIFPTFTDDPYTSPGTKFPELRCNTLPLPGMQGRAEVVGPPHAQVEWEEPNKERSRHDDRVRCIVDGLGSIQPGTEDRRSMDKSRCTSTAWSS